MSDVYDKPVDEQKFKNAFNTLLDSMRLQLKIDKNKNAVKQAWLLGIGLLKSLRQTLSGRGLITFPKQRLYLIRRKITCAGSGSSLIGAECVG